MKNAKEIFNSVKEILDSDKENKHVEETINKLKVELHNWDMYALIRKLLVNYGDKFYFQFYNDKSKKDTLTLIAISKESVIIDSELVSHLHNDVEKLSKKDPFCLSYKYFDSMILNMNGIINDNNYILKDIKENDK